MDSLSYPVRGNGRWMILTGTVFIALLGLFQSIPRAGFFLLLFNAGYFSAFYMDVVSTTVMGRDEVPDWPSFNHFLEDIISPLLLMVGILLLSFGPFAAMGFLPHQEEPWFLPVRIVALAYGCGYLPMAVLAGAVSGGIGAALPHIVIPAILRSLPRYLITVLALILSSLSCWGIQELCRRIPHLSWILASAVGLYGLMVQARLIGLIYRDQRDQLGWE